MKYLRRQLYQRAALAVVVLTVTTTLIIPLVMGFVYEGRAPINWSSPKD